MKINNLLKSIFLSASLLLISPLAVSELSADTFEVVGMRVITNKESFLNPDYLDIKVIMDAPAKTYNAVMGVINYDPEFLVIERATIDDSFCALIVPNLPSESEGRKTVICGNPEANATTTMTLVDIRFTKIKAGWTNINLDDSRMLSNDGLGRDLLIANESHDFLIEK